MTIAQIEHAETCSDPLPEQDAFDRMEDAINRRRREIIIAKTKQVQLTRFDARFTDAESQFADRRGLILSQQTQAEIARKRIELEIIDVARLIAAEADRGELLEETI
jgi:hypothetical protein